MIQQAEILLQANLKLEKDINVLANQVKEHSLGHFVWCSTYYDLRSDDLTGLILQYYNKERDNNYVVKYPSSIDIKKFLGPLKVLKYLFFCKKETVTKGNTLKRDFWFYTSGTSSRHRYRNLFNYIDKKKYNVDRVFYSDNPTKDIDSKDFHVSINLLSYYKFSDVLKAISRAFKVKILLTNIKGSSILVKWVKKTPLTQIFNICLREIIIQRAIVEEKPKAIFFSTANTYSPARLLARIAKQQNIPFIVVACRSMFSPLRSEERATDADIKEYNDARIADYWIVWDKFSLDTLKSTGIDNDKIYVSQPLIKQESKTYCISNNYLLLLTHEEELNTIFIDEWVKIAPNIKKISIRTHPLCKLNASQKEKLSIYDVEDISHVPMKDIDFKNIISVSINSTAAVEACSYGCGILWLPYLNDRSVIFAPVMEIIGFSAENTSEAHDFITENTIAENSRSFINQCINNYELHFKTTDNVVNLFEKLTL